jgi:hypothetical protein
MATDDQRRDLRAELLSDLEQIEDNAALFGEGRQSAYQTVALQLRNLLLGGRSALLNRVLPYATFHPIRDKGDDVLEEPLPPGRHRTTLFGHAVLRVPWHGRPGAITLPVDESLAPVSVNRWIDQWVLVPGIKIRDLVASTANEEVAHTNDARGSVLAQLSGMQVSMIWPQHVEARRFDQGFDAQQLYQMAIVGIGEYVARRVRVLLEAQSTPNA